MRIYLEIIGGPHIARTIALNPGDISRVGRAEKADWHLSDDKELSDIHFTITADGQSGLLYDLGSKSGTFLNGSQTSFAKIEHGDLIRAGNSTFAVFLENGIPVDSGKTAGSALITTPLSKLIRVLRSSRQSLFAVLDAARDSRILPLLKASNARFQSLYNGASETQLAEVAPYLVDFSKADPFLEQVIRHGWGKAWGIFCTSSYSFAEIRKHFRHFLMVLSPEGEYLYFRFYDPGVLRSFLPVCKQSEIEDFFGPIEDYWIEDLSPATILHYSRKESFFNINKLAITE